MSVCLRVPKVLSVYFVAKMTEKENKKQLYKGYNKII